MDISLLVMADNSLAPEYSAGDIIDVSKGHTDDCAHPRFYLVHLTDIPRTISIVKFLARLKNMLEASYQDDILTEPTTVRGRQWMLDIESLPQAAKDRLNSNRAVTVKWDNAKPYLRKKVVVDKADSTQDQFVAIKDGDL